MNLRATYNPLEPQACGVQDKGSTHQAIKQDGRAILSVHGYKVMRELSEGWSLVAHPNGPAIANGDWLCGIRFSESDPVVPAKVVNEAIEAVRELTWPLVKETFI